MYFTMINQHPLDMVKVSFAGFVPSSTSWAPSYTTLNTASFTSAQSTETNTNQDQMSKSWKHKHPREWSQQEVISWLLHLNQNLNLPTRVNNTDLNMSSYSGLCGADLVNMHCEHFYKRDPLNAMFVYLSLQDMTRSNEPLCMKVTRRESPDAEFIDKTSPDGLIKVEDDLDPSALKPSTEMDPSVYDKSDTFSSIKSEPMDERNELPSMPTLQYRPQHELSAAKVHPPPSESKIEKIKDAPTLPLHKPASPIPQGPYGCSYNKQITQSQGVYLQPPTAHEQALSYYQPFSFIPMVTDQSNHSQTTSLSESKSTHLWEFVRDILYDPRCNPSIIKWENKETGVFRLIRSDSVAKLWGQRKNNPTMTYEKLSRAMRYYYQRRILERIDGKRLVYKFGPMATGWRSPYF